VDTRRLDRHPRGEIATNGTFDLPESDQVREDPDREIRRGLLDEDGSRQGIPLPRIRPGQTKRGVLAVAARSELVREFDQIWPGGIQSTAQFSRGEQQPKATVVVEELLWRKGERPIDEVAGGVCRNQRGHASQFTTDRPPICEGHSNRSPF